MQHFFCCCQFNICWKWLTFFAFFFTSSDDKKRSNKSARIFPTQESVPLQNLINWFKYQMIIRARACFVKTLWLSYWSLPLAPAPALELPQKEATVNQRGRSLHSHLIVSSISAFVSLSYIRYIHAWSISTIYSNPPNKSFT